ncbi:MAG: RidA family protein [Pseudomonadota bacterium]
MKADQRLYDLGLELPDLSKPAGKYAHYVEIDDMIYLSGKGPFSLDGSPVTGKVGADVTIKEAREHARSIALLQLAALREALGGSLGRVRQVVKVLGMVNAAPDFTQHPKVIDGFSDVFIKVFGKPGRGARSAVGMGSLPGNITVEIEAIVALHPIGTDDHP